MFTFTDGELVLIPGLVVVFLALPLFGWIWGMDRDQTWRLMATLALAHVTLVIALTIFPIPIAGQELYRQTRGMSDDNVIPFATIVWQVSHPSFNTFRQLAGNMVVLAPLGVYGPYLWPALRGWWRLLLAALAGSAAIELTQYAGSWIEGFTYRVTDVDDAIMNTTGAMAAFFIWTAALRRFPRSGLPWPPTT